MSTPVVTIDESGIHAPSFVDVLTYVQDAYRSIYGQDIDIAADKQDGQLLAIFAAALNDANLSALAAFNSFIPSYAVGAGLSSLVKINGIARQVASASTVVLTLGGSEGTIITNALVGDGVNYATQWFISQTVVIPPSGQIDVLAVCTTLGDVKAAAGTLTQILTPTPGWQTSTNAMPAVPGAPVESDAQLRRRQAGSTANAAMTVLASIQGNLLALPGVTRAKVFQNDTVLTDPVTGIPARSIACVVEGGDPQQIAATIAHIKAPGVPTYGNTHVTVYDPKGVPNYISYWQLTTVETRALLWVTAIVGYTDAVHNYIQVSLAEFFNSRDIGQSVLLGDAYSPANLDGDDAITGTGLLQAQLDPLGQSYSIDAPYGLALSRAGMEAAGGPFGEGATVIGVTNGGLFKTGQTIWVTLDNGTFYQAVITGGITASQITIAPGVPSARQVLTNDPIYVVGDIFIQFMEASTCLASTDVIINAH